MPQYQSCPQGHRWEVVDGATGECPICATGSNPPLDDSTVFNKAGAKAASTATSEQARPRLPDFEILGELGRGGMGIVYKSRQISRDRLVALKVIRKDRLLHAEAVQRFRREAHAAQRLAHPNVVLVYDSDHSGDTHYLVMEYVAGTTLERLVERSGPLTVAQACDYIRQSALGLQHAHEQALVHRDIKPANLMVTWPGTKGALPTSDAGGIIKILDMGVARLYGQAPGESLTTLTQGGMVIGTADFIAPEQLEDPHGADIRADLYSLGCTFYYLLTGQVPFPGGNLIQKLDRQRWETPPAVNQLRTDVPEPVVGVIRKLMAKNPGERYQTPGEVAGDIEGLTRRGYVAARAAMSVITESRPFVGHSDAVLSVAVCGDGTIVSGGRDHTLRVWDAATGKEKRSLPRQGQEVLAVAGSPTEAHFLAATGVTMRLWDAASGRELLRFAGHTDAVRCVAFSCDGRHALSASDDRTVRVWDLPGGRESMRFTRHTTPVTGLAVSRDRTHVLSAGRDAILRYWELNTGKEVRTWPVPRGQIFQIGLSPDGIYALSAHFDTFLRLWDLETSRELRRFHGHKQMVTAAAFTPDGRRIVSGSHDQTVRLWDIDSGCEIACFGGHSGGVTCVALTGDEHVISGSADKTLRLWKLPE